MMIDLRIYGALRVVLLATAAATPLALSWSTAAIARPGDRSVRFDIPASDLADALRSYIDQSGEWIMFSDSAVRGQQSPGVRGMLPTTEALRRLLSGSDILVRPGMNGVTVLQPRAPAPHFIRTAAAPPPLAFPVAAAPAIAPVANGGEEIVVTAQRVTQNLQDVPVSVAVVSGSVLAERNIRTLEDLSTQQPAIRVAQGGGADQLHVRGVGSGFNGGFEQSVATFVDGIYRSRSRSSRIALFDIERVEILKGPQTTFFGANAIAGALNITTRKAGDTFAANMSALYSPNDGEYNVEGGVSFPLSQDFAMRVAGRASGMNGYIRNTVQGDKGPHLRDWQGRASLHFDSGRLTIDARYDIARLRDRGVLNLELVGCPPPGRNPSALCARALALSGGAIDDDLNYRSATGSPTFSDQDMDEAALSARLDLGFASLVATTGYVDQYTDQLFDVGQSFGTSPVGTTSYLPFRGVEDFEQFSQELRIESDGAGPFDYMFGGYYEKGRLSTPTYGGFYLANFANFIPDLVPANSLLSARTLFDQHSDTVSGFGSLSYHLTPQFAISGSLRYSRVVKRASRAVLYGTAGPFPSADNFVPLGAAVQNPLAALIGISSASFPNRRRVDDAFMPSARATYNINDNVMVYGSYTRGFKAGGFSATSPDVFDPEYVNNYEGGVKATWLDRRLITNIAIYRADYSNLQEAQNIPTPGGAFLSVIRNAAKSRSRGVELSSSFRVTSELKLRADVSYLDSKYISYKNAPCAPYEAAPGSACARDASGQRRAFAPKWSGSIGADLDKPLSDGVNLGLGATLAFTSDYYQQAVVSEYVEQPSYAKIDARIGLHAPDRRWEVALIGRNLTDKITAGFRNYAPASGATVIALPDRPRSFAIQVSGKW